MDPDLVNAGGLGAVAALLAAAWKYRSALWQWLPSFKSSDGKPGEAPTVGQKHQALLVLESSKDELPGYYKGLAQVRRNFLPPIKVEGKSSVEG